jgi:hypothetical protein
MNPRIRDRIKNGLEFIVGMTILGYIKTSEISNQFIVGNVPDAIYPMTNYAGIRAFLGFDKPNLALALGIATLGTAAEIAQKYPSFIEFIDPINLLSRYYDPVDIPMYFIGALAAYGFDKATYNSKVNGS